MSDKEEARVWLRKNGYDKIADLIDEIMSEWKEAGKSTRRNWWDILAGDKNGKPKNVAGREFPVLKVAQSRQGKPVSKSAISRSRKEEKQSVWKLARWEGHIPNHEKEKE